MLDENSRLAVRVVEAAELLSLGRSKTYSMVKNGELPSIRIGGSIRVPYAALCIWLEERLAASEGKAGQAGTPQDSAS